MPTIYQQICTAAAVNGALAAKERARIGAPQPLTLYFKGCTDQENGSLKLVPRDLVPPDGFVRAEGVPPLPPSAPYWQYIGWVEDHARRLPILCPTPAESRMHAAAAETRADLAAGRCVTETVDAHLQRLSRL